MWLVSAFVNILPHGSAHRNAFLLNVSLHAHRAFTALLSAGLRLSLLWCGGAALFADMTTGGWHASRWCAACCKLSCVTSVSVGHVFVCGMHTNLPGQLLSGSEQLRAWFSSFCPTAQM